jgi:hypothetical protein
VTEGLSSLDAQLDEFLTLPENWDSYHAARIGEDAVKAVRHMQVIPTVRGGVSVEWHTDDCDAEIEFNESGKIVNVMWARNDD